MSDCADRSCLRVCIGFFMLWMGFMCLIYLICALRTNVCFVVIFLSLLCAFGCLAGAYWSLGEDYTGKAGYAGKLVIVSFTISGGS